MIPPGRKIRPKRITDESLMAAISVAHARVAKGDWKKDHCKAYLTVEGVQCVRCQLYSTKCSANTRIRQVSHLGNMFVNILVRHAVQCRTYLTQNVAQISIANRAFAKEMSRLAIYSNKRHWRVKGSGTLTIRAMAHSCHLSKRQTFVAAHRCRDAHLFLG